MAALRLMEARLTAADVQMRHSVDSSIELEGRPGDLNQVFLNLLDNAARAVGDRGTIEVTAGLEGDDYVIRVCDTGKGIEPEMFERIFEPFWTSRPAGQGSGLGLAIAKQVVEQHRGTIRVERSALGGAGFIVRLPGAQRILESGPLPGGEAKAIPA